MTTTTWIPNIHPMLVHFPIAFLFAAITIEFIGLIIKEYQQAGFIADILIWSGTLFALITLSTGLQAAPTVAISAEAKTALAAHELTAKITVTFFMLYSIIRIFRYRNRQKIKTAAIITVFFMGCIGLIGIYKTAERGARLVHEYGIGVRK